MSDQATEERIAHNEVVFREANERIEQVADDHALEARPVPFVCECADTTCVTLVRVTLADYRRVRGNARRFVVAPGHEAVLGDEGAVVERHREYLVVEKQGRAGEVAEELAGG